MADPTAVLREATLLMTEANDALDAVADAQAQRWNRLRRVVEDAGDQYLDMRIGSIEESLRDKGGSIWLSVIVNVAITFIPITAMTTKFIGALTTSGRKLLTRARRLQVSKAEKAFERELDDERLLKLANSRVDLIKSIAATEESVVKFAKRWDPELSNTLQNYANELGTVVAEQPFKRGQPPAAPSAKSRPRDAPFVVVKSRMHDWIDSHVTAENIARRMQKERVATLFAIATALDPKKEAETRYDAARALEAKRQPKVPLRQPVPELPQKSADAIDELKRIRDDTMPTTNELFTASDKDQFRDLQLMIEAAIWATAYDFSVVLKTPKSKLSPPDVELLPLPSELWDRLTERYIDPDERRSYKDVGKHYRLGTKASPLMDEKVSRELFRTQGDGWDPRARLSYYFSKVIYPEVVEQNSTFVAMVKRQG